MKQELLRVHNLNLPTPYGLSLRNICFEIFKGETTAVMEVDGSGGSIFLDTLCGCLPFYTGEIYMDDKPVRLSDEVTAGHLGIHRISNESGLIDQLSIAENIFIIRSNSLNKVFVKKNIMNAQAAGLLQKIGLEMNPNIIASKLTRAEKHLVELVKAVSRGARLIVFDKTFSLYTVQELMRIQNIMSQLKSIGISFIINCNFLEEARLLSEKIVFFRDGQISKKIRICDLQTNMIADYISDSVICSAKSYEKGKKSGTAFEIVNLKLCENLPPINFKVLHGETVSLIDVDMTEKERLFRLVSGREKQHKMSFYLNGRRLTYKNEQQLLGQRILSFRSPGMSGDLLPNLSIRENIILPSLKKASGPLGYVSKKILCMPIGKFQNGCVENRPTLDRNGQISVLLERWYMFHPEVVIMFEPFYMCDMIGENLILDFVRHLNMEGTAVLFIASRTQKLENCSDQILYVKDGRLTGLLERNQNP